MGSPTVPIYRMTGQLVHAIEGRENVVLAQKYLLEPDMEEYLDPPLGSKRVDDDTVIPGVVSRLQWHLDSNGLDYYVEAICVRELTDDELKQLGEEVSGQNSDGHGENFEQQDFAWADGDGCHGEECELDDDDCEAGHMASFDWQTNEHKFVRVS